MVNADYQVIVLAAGSGNSLRPLTKELPKALIPVGNKPLIWYTLRRLEQQGFSHITIVVQKSDTKLIDYLREAYPASSPASTKLRISTTDTDNAADALRSVKDKIKTNFIIASCDLMASFDTNDVIDQHRLNKATATAVFGDMSLPYQEYTLADKRVLTEKNKERSFHDFITLDPTSNRLLGMKDIADIYGDQLTISKRCLKSFPNLRISTHLHDAHFFVFERWVLDYLCANPEIDTLRELMNYLIRAQYRDKLAASMLATSSLSPCPSKAPLDVDPAHLALSVTNAMPLYSKPGSASSHVRCFAYKANSLCLRANRFERYLIANQAATCTKQEIAAMFASDLADMNSPIGTESFCGKGVKLGEKCVFKKSIIGNHCIIGKNVKILNSVILDHVTIQDGTVVLNTIVCSDVLINARSDIKDSKIGPGSTIAAKAQLKNEILQNEDDISF